MKIALCTLAKNEMDILPQSLAFNSPKADFVITIDNASTDGTAEWLQNQASDKFIVIQDSTVCAHFMYFYNIMARRAIELGADWIFYADADEFFAGDIRSEIEQAITEGYDYIYTATFYNFVPTCLDSLIEKNHVIKCQWHLPEDQRVLSYRLRKVFHSVKDFKQIRDGNHDVYFFGEEKKFKETKGIKLFHYGYRSYEHFKNKVLKRGELFETAKIRRGIGAYERSIFRNYHDKGDETAIQAEWNRIYASTAEIVEQRRLIRDNTVAKFFEP